MSSTASSRALALLAALAVVGGCDDDGGRGSAAPGPDAAPSAGDVGVRCVADFGVWVSHIEPLVEAWCGACHGPEPRFGAPFELSYNDLNSHVRRAAFVESLRSGQMPPPAQPQPDGAARAAMIAWATCGADDTPPDGPAPGGFDVDRPILAAPDAPPAGADFFELRADGFALPADEADRYQCFTFAAPIGERRLIRRIEAVIDDARVVHHAVLIPDGAGREPGQSGPCRDDNPLSLIYGWAPGQGALHFDEGGIELAPGQRLTVQIHYNNAAGHADVRDASGVRIWHAPVEPAAPRVDMLAFGPLDFWVPPRSTGSATGYCVMPRDTTLIASFPHMHEAGVGFEQHVLRVDGTTEGIIRIDGWDFDSQYIYETPVELRAGDTVVTRCDYRNVGDDSVVSGTATAEEMCFNFAYVTPPLPSRYCNRMWSGEQTPYALGACAPPDATVEGAARVGGRYAEGEPVAATGGPAPAGRYRLAGYTLVFGSYDIELGVIDPELSQSSAVGQAWVRDGRLEIDVIVDVFLTDGLAAIEHALPVSLGATIDALDPSTGRLDVTPTCGGRGRVDVAYETRVDGTLRLVVRPSHLGIEVAFDLVFEPAP